MWTPKGTLNRRWDTDTEVETEGNHEYYEEEKKV